MKSQLEAEEQHPELGAFRRWFSPDLTKGNNLDLAGNIGQWVKFNDAANRGYALGRTGLLPHKIVHLQTVHGGSTGGKPEKSVWPSSSPGRGDADHG